MRLLPLPLVSVIGELLAITQLRGLPANTNHHVYHHQLSTTITFEHLGPRGHLWWYITFHGILIRARLRLAHHTPPDLRTRTHLSQSDRMP